MYIRINVLIVKDKRKMIPDTPDIEKLCTLQICYFFEETFVKDPSSKRKGIKVQTFGFVLAENVAFEFHPQIHIY